MQKFQCVNCGSENIQKVRVVYESQTKIEEPENQNTSLFFYHNSGEGDEDNGINSILSSILVSTALSTISNVPNAVPNKKQTPLARRLENFEIEDPEKYQQGVFNKKLEHIYESLDNLEQPLRQLTKSKTQLDNHITFLITEIILAVAFILSFIDFLSNSNISDWYVLPISIFFLLIIIFLEFKRTKELKEVLKKHKYKNKKNLQKALVRKIHQIHAKRIELYRKAENEREEIINAIKKQNTDKLSIWSNLYYCHRCDNVMDLNYKIYDASENIQQVINKAYNAKIFQ